jgi:hypothetical protein
VPKGKEDPVPDRPRLNPAMPRPAPAAGGRCTLRLALALSLVAPLLYACIALGGRPRPAPRLAPVYSVGTLRAYLAHHPTPPGGLLVGVRAQAEPCQAWDSLHSPLRCPRLEPVLVDPDGTDLADPLPLVIGSGSPLLAALRRLPLVSRLMPAPPQMQWDALTTYQVRLQPIAGEPCGAAICYQAVLLDAAP